MTGKELRKYGLVVLTGNTNPADEKIVTYMDELARNDFTTGIEMWEFMLSTYAEKLGSQEIAGNIEGRLFETLQRVSDARLRQTLGSNPQLLKLVYNQSITAASGANLAYLTSLVLTSKIDAADEILKLIATNKTGDFNTRMTTIIDDVFETQCRKNATRVPSLNRKQTMLLLEYALKMKGPQKAVLTQRIKELG